jgi:pyruvate-ferredoxin/flavodoxin oxidoreductase
VGCHQFDFTSKLDVLERAREGAVLLLNSPYPADSVWQELPEELQAQIIAKRISLYVVDAHQIARKAKLDRRINTVMQTCDK